MMAILILMCRTGAPASLLDEMFGPKTVFVPKMPSLGLLLEYPIFESYNEKVDKQSQLPTHHDEYRPKILFEIYKDQMEQFKNEHIYSTMWATEDEYGV
jgi:tRNA pseudouridine38-40 synthase